MYANLVQDNRGFGPVDGLVSELQDFTRRLAGLSNIDVVAGQSNEIDVKELRPSMSLLQLSKMIIEDRKQRDRSFCPGLVSDPTWDILIALFVDQLENRTVSVSRASLAAKIPATTALRYLSRMESDGLIKRTSHPSDKRVTTVTLTAGCYSKIDAYLRKFAGQWNIELDALAHRVVDDGTSFQQL